MTNNPYETYKQQSVMTMTPGQILIAVYDELIKQLNIAILSFENNDMMEINRSLQKSQRIINELRATLNYDYEISKNLEDIYNFLNRAIMNANIKKDPSDLKDVLEIATGLRDAFSTAEKSTR